MKNAFIFEATTLQIRGSKQLAPLQGGLFLFHCKRVFDSYRAAACLYRALRSVISANVELSAVLARPLFCLAKNDNFTHEYQFHQQFRGIVCQKSGANQRVDGLQHRAFTRCKERDPQAFAHCGCDGSQDVPSRREIQKGFRDAIRAAIRPAMAAFQAVLIQSETHNFFISNTGFTVVG